MHFAGRGHPSIRATHAKTLEISGDAEITARATCVVAVSARSDPPGAMAGPVRLELIVGEHRAVVHALANSSWTPGGPAVVRRSPLRLPGTFATDADLAAAELPRELVQALQDRAAGVEIDVQPAPTEHDTVVLFAADAARAEDPRLRAELAAAHEVISEDELARRLVHSLTPPEPGVPPPTGPARRLLVVATEALPGTATELSRRAGAVDTVGLSPDLAAAAAATGSGPVVLAPRGTDVRRLLHFTPADHRLVFDVRADRLDELLALARAERGTGTAVVSRPHAAPRRVTEGDGALYAPAQHLFCCLEPVSMTVIGSEAAHRPVLDPAVRACVAALVADGVSTRTAARALSELTGLPRREAYAAVLDVGRQSR